MRKIVFASVAGLALAASLAAPATAATGALDTAYGLAEPITGNLLTSKAAACAPGGACGFGTGSAQDFGTNYGDVAVGEQHGLINTNGAPLVHADLRCVAPWSKGMGGIGGFAAWGNDADCNTAPVGQYHEKGGILS